MFRLLNSVCFLRTGIPVGLCSIANMDIMDELQKIDLHPLTTNHYSWNLQSMLNFIVMFTQ